MSKEDEGECLLVSQDPPVGMAAARRPKEAMVVKIESCIEFECAVKLENGRSSCCLLYVDMELKETIFRDYVVMDSPRSSRSECWRVMKL